MTYVNRMSLPVLLLLIHAAVTVTTGWRWVFWVMVVLVSLDMVLQTWQQRRANELLDETRDRLEKMRAAGIPIPKR